MLCAVHNRFWTREQLRSEGWSDRSVRQAVAEGRLILVRRGRFAAPKTPEGLIRAMRVGGPATAATAAAAVGVWTGSGSDDELHVAVRPTTGRLMDPDDPRRPFDGRKDVHVRWTDGLPKSAFLTGVVPTLVMLQHMLLQVDPATAVAALDSALRLRLLHERDREVLSARLPVHLRALVAAADRRCESGIESITRFRLQLLGLLVEPQVVIPGVGRVDLLVQGRLIVELDGREFHEGRFEEDRVRDAEAALRRYRTLRFTWAQVLFDWPAVESAILGALAA
jgi:very-short-patch-repair endonuclease